MTPEEKKRYMREYMREYNQRSSARLKRSRRRTEKYRTDPEYREQQKARNRAYRAKLKAEKHDND